MGISASSNTGVRMATACDVGLRNIIFNCQCDRPARATRRPAAKTPKSERQPRDVDFTEDAEDDQKDPQDPEADYDPKHRARQKTFFYLARSIFTFLNSKLPRKADSQAYFAR